MHWVAAKKNCLTTNCNYRTEVFWHTRAQCANQDQSDSNKTTAEWANSLHLLIIKIFITSNICKWCNILFTYCTKWYVPLHSVFVIQFPLYKNFPVGQKQPSTQPPLQSISSLVSQVWGHDGPHCWYTIPDGQVIAVNENAL